MEEVGRHGRLGENGDLGCCALRPSGSDYVPVKIDEKEAQASLMRCKLKLVES